MMQKLRPVLLVIVCLALSVLVWLDYAGNDPSSGDTSRATSEVASDLKAADEARTAADALEEVYRTGMDKGRAEAGKLSADAKSEAIRNTEKAVAKADKAIAAKIDKATTKVAEARASARAEIEAVAADAAQAMIQRVAGLDVDTDTARAAVAKELANG